MGFFSTLCKGCGHPLLSQHATNHINYWMTTGVDISPTGQVTIGIYDGYGRLVDDDGLSDGITDGGFGVEHEMDQADTTWHWSCWKKAGEPRNYAGPSEDAPDQGFFFDDPTHDLADPLDDTMNALRFVAFCDPMFDRGETVCADHADFAAEYRPDKWEPWEADGTCFICAEDAHIAQAERSMT